MGQCTCKEGAQVLSRDQPTPDWKVTVEEAERHFPAGCDVGGGVWMRVDNVEGKDEKESTIAHVTERIKDLKETSNLLVNKQQCKHQTYIVADQYVSCI